MRRGPLFNAAARRRVSAAPRSGSAVPPPPPPPDPDPDPDPDPGPFPGVLATTVAVDNRLPLTGVLNASAQTDLIVEFGLPIRANFLQDSERIVVHDGATQLTVEEVCRTTDMNGYLRYVSLAVLLPTLDSSEVARVLTITSETGAPATGATKTVAQLLAMDTDAECTVTLTDPHYNYAVTGDWTANFRLAAAGSTTYARLAAHLCPGWIVDGNLRKTFKCVMPFMQGATPHDYLTCEFWATAYSDDGFTSDISWKWEVVICNGRRSSPVGAAANWYFGLNITTGIASPLTIHDFPDRSLPDVATHTTATTISCVPGSFDLNDRGRAMMVTATGLCAVIRSVTTSTASMEMSGISRVPTPVGATYAVGEIKVRGCYVKAGHHLWLQTAVHNREHKYMVRHERDYLFNTRHILNYAIPSSYVPLSFSSTAALTTLNALGNNPMRYGGGYIGEQATGNGDEGHPYPVPAYLSFREMDGHVGPYVVEHAYRRCFVNAYLQFNHMAFGERRDSTGLLVTRDVNLVEHDVQSGYSFKIPGSNVGAFHSDNHGPWPWLMTGNPVYMLDMHKMVAQIYMGSKSNPTSNFRNMWSGQETRAVAWQLCYIGHSVAMTPDDWPVGVTGWDQEILRDWQTDYNEYGVYFYLDDGTGSGRGASALCADYSLDDYDNTFRINISFGDNLASTSGGGFGWHMSYNGWVAAFLDGLGVIDDNSRRLFTRIYESGVQRLVHPGILDPGVVFGTGTSVNPTLGYAAWYTTQAAADPPAPRQPFYSAYLWNLLVLADELSWCRDSGDTREALDVALDYVPGVETGTRGIDRVKTLSNSTSSSNKWYQKSWIAKRAD